MADQDCERHWNTIALGIVTVATAAIGGALFIIERTTAPVSLTTTLATYFLELIAIVAYLYVLILARRAIFSTSAQLREQKTSKRSLTHLLYGWFFIELFALAGPLIGLTFVGLLESLQKVS